MRLSAARYRNRTVAGFVVSGQTQGMTSRRTSSSGDGPRPRYSDEPASTPEDDNAEPPESSTGLAVHRVGGWRQLPNAAPEQVMGWRIKPPRNGRKT